VAGRDKCTRGNTRAGADQLAGNAAKLSDSLLL
jgi:hypothetical protein